MNTRKTVGPTLSIGGRFVENSSQNPVRGEDGSLYWCKDDKGVILHRENDLPAVIFANGMKEWRWEGLRHREDGKPAVVCEGEFEKWFIHGEQHRSDDKPASVWANGRLEWFVNGKRHRDGDLPAGIYEDGSQIWWKHGLRHRIGSPAIISPQGSKTWCEDGLIHRADGPAMQEANGEEDKWFVRGLQLIGDDLVAYQKAISPETSPSVLRDLTHHENLNVSRAASLNSNCLLEDQIEWTLTFGAEVE